MIYICAAFCSFKSANSVNWAHNRDHVTATTLAMMVQGFIHTRTSLLFVLASGLLPTTASPSPATSVTVTFSAPTIVDDFTPSPHNGGQLGVPENFHSLLSGSSAYTLLGRVGPAPNGWALPAPAAEETRWDVSVDGGTTWQHNVASLCGGARLVSARTRTSSNCTGGATSAARQTSAKMLRAATYYVQHNASAVTYAASANSSWIGDSRWHVPDMETTTFNVAGWKSVGAVTIRSASDDDEGWRYAVTANPQVWEWKGIPSPGLNISASHRYNGPRIYSSTRLRGGGFVAAVCIHFNGVRRKPLAPLHLVNASRTCGRVSHDLPLISKLAKSVA